MELEEFVHQFGGGDGLRLAAHVADTYVATEISKFDRADIPDMSTTQPESLHWLSNYIVNSVLCGALPSPQREHRFGFLRHATIAYSEHNMARYATLGFLECPEQSFGRYFTAIHHWEQFLGAAWLALDELREAGLVGQLYDAGDGSVAEQLHGLHNQANDTTARIDNGYVHPPCSPAMWLCNSGLRSTDYDLTFAETGELLSKIRDWARVAEDPLQGRPYDWARD